MEPVRGVNFRGNDQMRVLPHNAEAEQSLLGAIMLDNELLENISDFLRPEHFATPINGKIYEAITKITAQGLTADPITLKAYFEKNNLLKNVNGGAYLVQLVDSVVSVSSAPDYAKIIYDLYLRRKLILLGENITKKASNFKLDENAREQLESAESELYKLASSDNQGGPVTFAAALSSTLPGLEAAYKSESSLIGITTGLIDLDKMTGGLSRSDLIILAGRPSMGKTALATNIAFNAAKAYSNKKDGGGKVVFFSLEMSKEQLITRLLGQECNIPSERIRKGEIREEDFMKILEAKKNMMDLSLSIDDTPALSVSSVRSRARKLKRQNGLDLIVIDYLQLLQGSPDNRRNDNRVLEISEITRSLKAIAKELDVPVIALSQLSRAVESRDDKRPQLADLRESGSIEQDADVVMFVFREEYYEERKQPTIGTDEYAKWMDKMTKVHNLAEVIMAKQRHGPVGTVRLFFDGKYTKFDNLSEDRKIES